MTTRIIRNEVRFYTRRSGDKAEVYKDGASRSEVSEARRRLNAIIAERNVLRLKLLRASS